MKSYPIAGVLLVALMVAGPTALGASFQTVVASGRAPLMEDNLQASREAALNEARLAAIGKALGRSLWTESYSDKNVAVRNEILSRMSGLIAGEEIVEEFSRAGFYVVTIRAKVAEDQDAGGDPRNLWVHNRKQGYPRLIVTMMDEPGQETPVAGEAAAQIRNRLAEAGFVVRSGFDRRAAWSGQSGGIGNEKTAAAPVRDGEIVIKGMVSAIDQGREPFGIFESAEANLTVRAEDGDTGELLASKVVGASGIASTRENARRKGAEVAADLAADYLIQTVLRSWVDESCNGTRCEMLVTNLTDYPDQLRRLIDDLLKVPGMVSVRERSWEKDQAELWLVYRGNSQNLRDFLFSDRYCPRGLQVVSFTPNRIIAEWESR